MHVSLKRYPQTQTRKGLDEGKEKERERIIQHEIIVRFGRNVRMIPWNEDEKLMGNDKT